MSLFVIELIPRPFKVDPESTKWKLQFLLDGPGIAQERQLMWAAMAMHGLADHRTPGFATHRQRLMIFRDRSVAAKRAKKLDNEYWKAVVREAREMEATE